MPSTNLSFAKVAATPTSSSWSQAYNAGSLFIALSLSSEDQTVQEQLPIQGKQILSNIEAEIFVLEDKRFETINAALPQALKDLPPEILLSLALAYIKDDTLYAFIVGGGRISLKRGSKIGNILSHIQDISDRSIHSSSGYLETNDLILLQTTQFAKSVSSETIEQALDYSLPNDIAETISPHVHGEEEGGSAAIILVFNGFSQVSDASQQEIAPHPETSPAPALMPERPSPEDLTSPTAELQEDQSEIIPQKKWLPHLSLPRIQMPRQKKIAAAAAILLLILLIASIFLIQSKRQADKEHTLFTQIYTSAKKDYDEGEALLSLNKSLARDDYQSAKSTLATAEGKFKPNSSEATQIANLLDQVNQRLSATQNATTVTTKEVDGTDAPSLLALKKDPSVEAATQDDDAIYTISQKAIISEAKSSSQKKSLVTNDNNWTKALSLGVFGGNLYVLDNKNGLLKFVPTSSSYVDSNYFKGDAPNLTQAVSMTIDGSIYFLFSDGSVEKYTRGEKDSFSLTGLEQGLSSPVAIFTTSDLKNLYVLDPKHNRVVKLDKSGTFIAEYQADAFKDATALEISKDEKAGFVFSDGKVYQFNL
ncbi:MAG TPA: hypothetical protein VG935_01185 [Patescibacteria group bacterium]|nr:hypothetical protein [Patescibacteria group bacterium]